MIAPDHPLDSLKTHNSLVDAFGKAHQRSFHHSLQVDEEFRSLYQKPFDTVVRAVAVALEGRYATLMLRVEEIAAMPDRAYAVKAFATEIPGALPLQRHFYQQLTDGDWLVHLARHKLVVEPLVESEGGDGVGDEEWPARDYLQRMAASTDQSTRKDVAAALRAIGTSGNPDVQAGGMEILVALPAAEAESLVDLAVSWLDRDATFGVVHAAERLVKKFAIEELSAALKLGAALLQVWNENGEVANLFGRQMYEHFLPAISEELTKAFREEGLRLLMQLMLDAGQIGGRLDYDHYSSRAVTDDEAVRYDVFAALVSVVRRSSEMIVAREPTRMPVVCGILNSHPAKIFKRLSMSVLATNPGAAPGLAEADLLDPGLVEESWAQFEYAALAIAWFPKLPLDKQQTILATVDAMPAKYVQAWKKRFEEHRGRPAAPDDERVFSETVVRDALWYWQSALPSDRRATLERIVGEHGDPNEWRTTLLREEQSPLDDADFAVRSVPEIVAFLRRWQPTKEQQLQTVTALAQRLRTAVDNNTKGYAANAEQFVGLKPIYVRRLLEGLRTAATNQKDFEWGGVLALIGHVVEQYKTPIDLADLHEGDDKDWTWAYKEAGELLGVGLRRGAASIGFEHAVSVQALVQAAVNRVPVRVEIDDFEQRYERDPYFAAQATLRGTMVELCIMHLFWLSQDSSNAMGSSPRDALSNHAQIRATLESQLADRSADGRIPRAIIGRYLRALFFFGEAWLKGQVSVLFPADHHELRRAAWRGHLGHDQGPVGELIGQMAVCYAEEIELSGADPATREHLDHYRKRLANYLMVLYLWGNLPETFLVLFWQQAPEDVRRQAIVFVGSQLGKLKPDQPREVGSRGLKYWTRRLSEARESNEPDRYRQELGGIGTWCLYDKIDPEWLCDQLVQLLKAGFAPGNAFMVVNWLERIAPNIVDRAVEVLAVLLRHPSTERWVFAGRPSEIRAVLLQGLAHGTPATINRARETIGFLASIGQTSYLDLVRPSSTE